MSDTTPEKKISDTARREEEILAFWNENDIFGKSLQKESPQGEYVFYDGPPFATGLPHHGHILAGTIKDTIPRYRTMRGFHVARRWGWDCHGLPLENQIEKKLGLHTKRDIERLGVEKFNQACFDAVLEYADDWKRIIPRLGRFVDMEHDYKTMDATYTESVMWVFSELARKGLVYEGFKSMHLCPRCGTTLSNFEVNQGYKDIKDISVTVKLPLLDNTGEVTDTSLLVWTTTPWTLPGNMAAAVHKDYDYVEIVVASEKMILAKERLGMITQEYEIVREFKGAELVGRSYVPPFAYYDSRERTPGIKLQGDFAHAWKVYHAEYVTLENGTGAVHLAPAYGEEDMLLAQKEGIPVVHHVDQEGHFMAHITDLAGRAVKPKDDKETNVLHTDADVEILKKLQANGRLFAKENIVHSYPHCWRCETPLLNYATSSWFVRVTDIKDDLVAENKKIAWVPEHIGSARFGNWLEGARDWAVSRQRYWGAPLPVWRNNTAGTYKVLGSLDEIRAHAKRSGNTYIKMRHGEADHNVSRIMSSDINDEHHLTERGKEQVRKTAESLRDTGIDYIYVSPLKRTRETAHMVAEILNIPTDRVIVDERLHENPAGIFQGKSVDEWYAYHSKLSVEEKLNHPYEGGESWLDIRARMVGVLFDLERKHQNTKILIISHGLPLRIMKWGGELVPAEDMPRRWDEDGDIPVGTTDTIDFIPFPHNRKYALDYHRPYIDEIELIDTDGTPLERVPDVFDCWFESGSMPYGQQHYPFENTEVFDPKAEKGYPADFISESVDQTRGWFYSLIVLGTALFGKAPYKHVITNGLVLAEDGRKMSKSLKNYPDPLDVVDQYGADTLRFYLLSSPIIRGEDLNFSEKSLAELGRKNLGRLANVLSFYELYKDANVDASGALGSTNVLDRWIIARLNEVVGEATAGYESYELDRATRPVTAFIDDLSVWYVRRSRERMKDADSEDQAMALATLRYVLRQLALVIAPSMPFFADYLYRAVRAESDPISVHLAPWPEAGAVDQSLLKEMQITRDLVTKALELRAEANIKVRQPLGSLIVRHELHDAGKPFHELVMAEVNVKELKSDPALNEELVLDTRITPELQAEGEIREVMRHIQDMRKESGLAPDDRISLMIDTDDVGQRHVRTHEALIMRTVGASALSFGAAPSGELALPERTYRVSITKQ